MAKYISTKSWKELLKSKDCKALSAPDLEKLITQFEGAEKKRDATVAETHFGKIKLKFRVLKKANAKNRTLIKWMDQASEEAEEIIAAIGVGTEDAADDKAADDAPAKPEEKAKEVAPPKEAKPTDSSREKSDPKAKDDDGTEEVPPSLDEAKRKALGETLANELTLAKRRPKAKASKFVLKPDAKSPGLMLTRKELNPGVKKAAIALSGKPGKTLKGLCYGDSGKWVFVFPTEPKTALIQLLKRAALLHAGMKIKLKVVGGGVELDDGEAADSQDGAKETAATANEQTPAKAAQEAAAPEPKSELEEAPDPLNPKLLKARLVAAVGGLKRAPAGDADATTALNGDLAAVSKAMKSKDFAAAAELIAKLEAQLAAPQEAPEDVPAAETEEAPEAEVEAKTAGDEDGEKEPSEDEADALRKANFDLAKARLQWEVARSRARGQAEEAIDAFSAEFPHATLLVNLVDQVLAELDEALRDALDDVISAASVEARQKHVERSRALAASLRIDVGDNETLAQLEKYPANEQGLVTPLLDSLAEVEKQLAA